MCGTVTQQVCAPLRARHDQCAQTQTCFPSALGPQCKTSGSENGKASVVEVKKGLCVTWGRGQTRQGRRWGALGYRLAEEKCLFPLFVCIALD